MPDAVPADEVVAAQEAGRERWSAGHPFPTCLVCGPAREDGLGIFPAACRAGTGCSARLDAQRVDRRRGRLRAAGARLGRARLPHERAGRQLERGPGDRAGEPDGSAGLSRAGGRAAHDPVVGARQGRAQGLGRRRAVRLGRRSSPAPRARSGSSCGSRVRAHGHALPDLSILRSHLRSRDRDRGHGRCVSVRGDADDVFSHGFICPKAYGIKQLHEDPDRLTTPLVRRDGELVEADLGRGVRGDRQAALADPRRARPERRGRLPRQPERAQPVGADPRPGAGCACSASQNLYSASTVDQMPKQVSAGHMFGTMLSVPIPDVDRCDHLLMLGANPLVSNGSLLTAPNMRGRLRAIRERGGKVVVIDPRRTRTAEEADEHHFIRPGTDALLLAAIACTIVEEGLDDAGRARRARERARRGARAGARVHARGGGGRMRHRGRRDPAHGARAGRGRARGRLRAHRHLHAGVRHARELARGRAERAHRQPRPRGRRDVHARGGRARRTRPAPGGGGRGRALRALEQPRARAAGVLRRAAGRPCSPRRSTRPARARCAR